MSSFREEARGQKQVVGIHHDLAVLFAETSQNLAGAVSNAHLAALFKDAAPRKMKTNIWARLRGQQEQLTIKVPNTRPYRQQSFSFGLFSLLESAAEKLLAMLSQKMACHIVSHYQ